MLTIDHYEPEFQHGLVSVMNLSSWRSDMSVYIVVARSEDHGSYELLMSKLRIVGAVLGMDMVAI